MAAYYVWSGAGGAANGTSWANAYLTLTLAFSGKVAGDTFYVAHDHAQATGSAVSLTVQGTIANPTKIICVNRAGSVPPVSADRRATATVSTTGNFGITFVGSAHYDGIIFTAGNSTGLASINLSNTGDFHRLDNCSLRLGGTSVSSRINIGQVNAAYVEWNNTTVSFANISQMIIVGSVFRWRNTASALLGTMPTILLLDAGGWGGEIECIGVDFSALGSGKTLVNPANGSVGMKFRIIDCKLNAAVTKSSAPTYPGGSEVDFIRTGSAGISYEVRRHRTSGLLTEETAIVRTGGALA